MRQMGKSSFSSDAPVKPGALLFGGLRTTLPAQCIGDGREQGLAVHSVRS